MVDWPSDMKLGIGSYTYMWAIGFEGAIPEDPMNAFDLLHEAKRLGVSVVQYGPNLPLDQLAPAELVQLVDDARSSGIEIEIGTKGLERESLLRQIELCTRCGATLLRTVTDYSNGAVAPDAARIVDDVGLVVPALAGAGVRLAIENARVPSATLKSALDQLATSWAGITLDTVNSLAVPEGTAQVAQTLAPYTMCLHVKDFAVERIWHMAGFTVEGRAAGRGQLDVPWLLEVLRGASVVPNVILELWTPKRGTVEDTVALERAWADESVPYLRGLIPG